MKGTGGMITKLQAIDFIRKHLPDCICYIISGREKGAIKKALKGELVGTKFPARSEHEKKPRPRNS